jgi:hypothetical protein
MSALVYHGPEDEPYYVTDSGYGIARAAGAGAFGIDLNARTCIASRLRWWRRVVVIVHWAEWWKHGFKAKPGTHVPHKPIEQLTLAQVKNLISEDGKHEILTAEEAAVLCEHHEIVPFFEMKPSTWRAAVLRRLRRFCAARQIRFCVMTIQAYGDTAAALDRWEKKAHQRLWLATAAQIPTLLLYRRHVDVALWAPVADGVKDHPRIGPILGLSAFIDKYLR